MKHVIAFGASSSRNSINRQLAAYAAGLLGDTEVELLDLNDFEMPLFSVDREAEIGQHALAQAFYQRIGACDGLVISFAEHNGSYSAAYKNLFDWTSRINPKVYQGKPAVLFSTSPGGRGGKSVMELATARLPREGADVRATLSIPGFYDAFDSENGEPLEASLRETIFDTVNQLFD